MTRGHVHGDPSSSYFVHDKFVTVRSTSEDDDFLLYYDTYRWVVVVYIRQSSWLEFFCEVAVSGCYLSKIITYIILSCFFREARLPKQPGELFFAFEVDAKEKAQRGAAALGGD